MQATVAELAELVGETYATIDCWSRVQLLDYERRGHKRLYDSESAADRCRRIRERQNDGLNLVAIREEFRQEANLGAREVEHDAEFREMRNRLYEIIGSFDARAVGRIRRPPRRSVASDRLRSLAAEFDERFRAMQRPEALTAAQAAFDADPEDFDDIAAGRK